MMHLHSRLILFVAGALLSSGGCFEYTHVPLDRAPIGQAVRVRLSDTGFLRLATTTAGDLPSLSRTMEGDLIAADSNTIAVAVRVWSGGAGPQNQLDQRLVIARRDVLELEVKELDRRKTTMVGAVAATAIAAFVVHELSGRFGGTTTGTPPSGPTEALLP